GAFWYIRRDTVQHMTLRHPIEDRASDRDELVLTPLYPTATQPAPTFAGNFWASPIVVTLPQKSPFLLLLPSSGQVVAVDMTSQAVQWVAALPHGPKQEVFSRAAPLQVENWLVVTYTLLDQDTGGKQHRAVVVDLATGRISSQFPTLTFAARVPAA